MLTQIYEIQTPSEAEAMISIGVDHIGSVVISADHWKNKIIQETIAEVRLLSAKSSLILLFDDADLISFALDFYRPDIVHFCQTVIHDPSRWEAQCGRLISLQATVKERFPEIAVMRSIPIVPPGEENPVDMEALISHFEPLSDYFLTDTYLVGESDNSCADQPVNGYIGITGRICDWQQAARLVESSRIPVILAGGLSEQNVYEAAVASRPAGVDSCTLTNAVDKSGKPVRFRKDPKKVAEFVAEARRAEKDIET